MDRTEVRRKGWVGDDQQRAYSLLTIKAIDADRRVITGIATTPRPDRDGDIVEPMGATFTNPVPLLYHHEFRAPVGTVTLTAHPDRISFEAHLPDIQTEGPLKARLDDAWASVKAGLIRGVSIGYRALKDGVKLLRTGGLHFTAYEIVELSLVSVPANAEATIHTIKSYDRLAPAALGAIETSASITSAVADARVVRVTTRVPSMHKSISDQIQQFEATRQAKNARMTDIMTKAGEEGRTLDEQEQQEYDGLKSDVKAVDDHLVRLHDLEAANKALAKPVTPDAGQDPHAAHAVRGGDHPVITVKQHLPPGIEFARMVICKLAAFISQGSISAMDVAKSRYPDNPRIQQYFKATVAGGTTTDTTWAGPLVDQTNLVGEFIEFLRPMTIIGKFGTGNVPSLRRVPFNIRVVGQTSGGTGYWVGQGAPKPVTKYDFEPTTLLWAKAAAIAVISEELARFSSPSAEQLVRDALAASIVERLDIDFIDPAKAASANVSPASITNGINPLATAGVDAAAVRTDLQNLFKAFIESNQNPAGAVIIMPNTLALALSLLVNALGQPEFPGMGMNGGTLHGLPVITSQYASYPSAGFGNIVVMVNASEIFLADDGQVTVDASREAALQMLDNPTNNIDGTATTMVSLWQTNSIGLKAERFINWARRRAQAVQWMDDVNWGSVGSPVG
jgi:HK97 family phage major capsid protein/HK97 family phage prohead protease